MSTVKESVVVKFGTDCVAQQEETSLGVLPVGVDPEFIEENAVNIATLACAYEVKVTSSGAVALGRKIAKDDGLPYETMDEQVLAGIGSGSLVEAWRPAFKRQGFTAVQGLVTHHELEQKEQEGSNLAKACQLMEGYPLIPIFNQNDLLIEKGKERDELTKIKTNEDNDWLAADLAWRIGARAVILCMKERDGFEIDGVVQKEVAGGEVESLIQQHVQPTYNGNFEKGGMKSKLRACSWAASQGIDAYICNFKTDLFQVVTGLGIATRVVQ